MDDEKLSGRVIIDTVLANMRQQIEELRYSKVVPAAYEVYLHGDDQQRFESLTHEIAAEAVRALEETLVALNRPSRLDRVRTWARMARVPYKKVGPWVVRITSDPENEVPRGRALVVSQITLGASDAYEGQRTRRLATLSDASVPVPAAVAAMTTGPTGAATSPGTTATEPTSAVLAETRESVEAVAVLAWEDASGAHRYRMTRHEVTLGRATQGSAADVRLAGPPDVSRVHARLRFEPEGGRFTIEDMSLLGTTVNGTALERGVPRDLEPPAEIRLADAVTVRLEKEVRP
jgi:hypothetical protein